LNANSCRSPAWHVREEIVFPINAPAAILRTMNQVALVTGASRGIGRGIAIELARIGFDLALNYASNHEAAQAAVQACHAVSTAAGKTIRCELVQADISLAPDREKLVGSVREHFGRIDLLVNNAGVAPNVRADLLEVGEASFDRLISTNVKGPFFLTQLAAKWMIQQRSSENPRLPLPKIVIISSISAYAASVNRGDYCVAKAALSMVTPLFAARLAEHGISVFEIRPGIIATDMTAPVREKYDHLISQGLTPIKRWGTPEDVGRAVAAVALDLLPFSTGEILNVDGGFHMRRL
jgi:3-oxoacyl-[acyl-carrier protein] reductase